MPRSASRNSEAPGTVEDFAAGSSPTNATAPPRGGVPGRLGEAQFRAGRVRAFERDLRRGRVGPYPDRAGAPTTRSGAAGLPRRPSMMTGSPGKRKSPAPGFGES